MHTDLPSLRPPRPRRRRGPAWTLASVALLLIAAGVWMMRPPRSVTESQVRREIIDLALARSAGEGRDDGGPLGPWWIQARSYEPTTGELLDFRIESGSMIIAARSGRVVVDTVQDTFSLSLDQVVLTRVPGPSDEALEHHLLQMDHHELGPVPYGRDIVTDVELRGPLRVPGSRTPLAGADSKRP